MKTTLKLTAAAMLATGCLSLSTASFAAACPAEQTLSAFIAAGNCTDVDKLYTYGDSDFGAISNDNISLQIDNFALGPVEIHNFSIDPVGALLAGTYDISYTIEITDPNRFFGNVSVDSDVPAAGEDVTIQKILDDDGNLGNGVVATLTSVGGVPDSVNLTPFTYQKFWITETITVGANGAVNSFTDTYTQQIRGTVPEPATLALLGLGLAGLGFARRRKQ